MALSDRDRQLLQHCMNRKPQAWEDFVDRFLPLATHIVNHTAESRRLQLSAQDREDLTSESFLAILKDDFAILRRFRGESSLSAYLTVVIRRVVIREALRRKSGRAASLQDAPEAPASSPENRIEDREQVEKLLQGLDETESQVVTLYHLEGKSYREISALTGVAENSIGPLLSRARAKMRQTADAENTAS